MAVYIFSDAHLGSSTAEHEREKTNRISRLFEIVKSNDARLVILGDLFDFWFEYKNAIPREYTDVLVLLRELVKSGIRVDYVSGNHDFWMGDYFETEMGLNLHRDHFDIDFAGKRIHLTHGDGLAPSDRGYRLLKRILRNRFNYWLYRKLPPDWAIPFAKRVSGSSRNHSSKRDHTFVAEYEQYARDVLARDFDIVVIGHLHIPAFEQYGDGFYINTGDFIDHYSYAVIDDDGPRLEYLK